MSTAPFAPLVQTNAAIGEPRLVRWLLIGASLLFLGVFLLLPLLAVFTQALASGLKAYFAAMVDPDALASIRLTLLTAAIASSGEIWYCWSLSGLSVMTIVR